MKTRIHNPVTERPRRRGVTTNDGRSAPPGSTAPESMSHVPDLHTRVRDDLAERIQNGVIPANSRILSERVLAEQFRVSRVTVRHALQQLESAGLVEVIGGARWARRSSAPPEDYKRSKLIEEGATGLVSFSDLAASNGLSATSVVLSNVTRASTLDEADLLAIAPGAFVLDLVRLRLLDGIPTVIDYSLIPEAFAPGLGELDFSRISLYHTLAETYGLQAIRADCAIEAWGANDEAASQLGLKRGDPVLVIVQITFGENGRIIQWCRSVYRGDRYRFRAILDGVEGAPRLRPRVAEPLARAPTFDRIKEPAA